MTPDQPQPAPEEEPSDAAPIDAAWVLRQAVILHAETMAAKAWPVAKSVLDLIGKHVDVQAFREQPAAQNPYGHLTYDELLERIAIYDAARNPPQYGEGDRRAQPGGGGGSPATAALPESPLHHPAGGPRPRAGEDR